jgi:alpha-tubulin suppressor-like RCC1 family protein
MSTNDSQIGIDPNYGQSRVPANVSNVVAIAGGGWHSLALLANGTIRGWGRDNHGQADAVGITNAVAIAAGASHSLALLADGTVRAWGANDYGQTNVPADLSNVVAIAAGGWHNLALRRDGTVVAWGAGSGSNTNVDFGQSTVPPGLSNVVQIAAGLVHSLVLTGSNPPASSAPLLAPVWETNVFRVSVATAPGRVYRLEYKDALSDSAWTGLPLRAGTGRALMLQDITANGNQRFYRVTRW